MKTGIELIAEERREQIEKHGRTVDLDVKHNTSYQLCKGATRITFAPDEEGADLMTYEIFVPDGWDKDIWKRMLNKPYKERLIIAGALIAAEIDRLQAE